MHYLKKKRLNVVNVVLRRRYATRFIGSESHLFPRPPHQPVLLVIAVGSIVLSPLLCE